MDAVTYELDQDESSIVAAVRDWVDREVKPAVRELEHANTYPDKLIEQMKQLGIFGLADPASRGATPQVSTLLLRRGHRGAGPRLDEPGRRDGRAHRRRQAAARLRHRGAEGPLPAADGDRRDPGHDGADRARRRLRPAGDAHDRAPRRRRLRRQRVQDVDHQRPPRRGSSRCCARPTRTPSPRTAGISILLAEHGRRLHRLPRPAQARLQGRGELRAGLRRLPRPGERAARRRARATGSRR